MKEFDKEQFNSFLENRKIPKTTLKSIMVQDVKINNVPVIERNEGSVDFTIGFDTTSKIYDLLSKNKKAKEIDYNYA